MTWNVFCCKNVSRLGWFLSVTIPPSLLELSWGYEESLGSLHTHLMFLLRKRERMKERGGESESRWKRVVGIFLSVACWHVKFSQLRSNFGWHESVKRVRAQACACVCVCVRVCVCAYGISAKRKRGSESISGCWLLQVSMKKLSPPLLSHSIAELGHSRPLKTLSSDLM